MTKSDMAILCGELNSMGKRTEATTLYGEWIQTHNNKDATNTEQSAANEAVMKFIADLPEKLRTKLDEAFNSAGSAHADQTLVGAA